MELEEAKERLKSLKENVFVLDCHAIDTVISELFAMQNLLDEKNEELDRLQKENDRLKNWKQYREIRETRRTTEAIEKARKEYYEKYPLKEE